MSRDLREHESALLGATLTAPQIIDDLELEPELFGSADLRELFAAIRAVHGRGVRPDEISISDELRTRGLERLILPLAELARTSAGNAAYYVRQLRDDLSRRKLRTVLREGLEALDDESRPVPETVDELERGLVSATTGSAEAQDPTLGAALPAYLLELEERSRDLREGRSRLLKTGFRSLDAVLGSIRPGEVVVIAARPGAGKTALALALAVHAAREGIASAFFSLEMHRAELLDRLLASRTEYPVGRLRSGSLRPEDFPDLVAAGEPLSKLPLAIFDGAQTLGTILSRIRREKAIRGIGLVVLDYLGLIPPDPGSRAPRWEQFANISRTLKLTALEMQTVLVSCVQLNRDADGREPTLGNLRDSGSIEQDADRVLLLHRTRPESNEVQVIIAKNRHGPTGRATLHFDGAHVRFF